MVPPKTPFDLAGYQEAGDSINGSSNNFYFLIQMEASALEVNNDIISIKKQL